MIDTYKLTVVMYHYVRDLKKSKFPNIKGLDIKLFDKQIRFFNNNYNIVSIDNILDYLDEKSNLPLNPLLLTFDDGFSDHYNNVFPVLKNLGLSACFYVPFRGIIEGKVLDVHKLHFILASSDIKKLINRIKCLMKEYAQEYKLKEFDYYYNKLAISSSLDCKNVIFVKRLLQAELEKDLRGLIVERLFTEHVTDDEKKFSKELYMSLTQLKDMINNGMHIGCHGYDHLWWNGLSKRELNAELNISLSYLHDLGVDNNWTACYPYGSYSRQVEKILKEKKCRMAFTTETGLYDLDSNTILTAPRFDTNDFL